MRTVLLDLDGTLVDSAALITTHLSAALASVGMHLSPAELTPLVGPPWETALPALGLDADRTAAAIAAYRGSYDTVAATQTPVYPGVPDLLDGLAAARLRLAVATSKPEHLARRIVEGVGFGGRFVLVGGADDRVGRIGKAAVVASVLDRLGLDPAREPLVMVGDRHHDVDGAAAHGVPTVGVGWGYATPGELAGAVAVATDPVDLLRLLTTDAGIWSTAAAGAR